MQEPLSISFRQAKATDWPHIWPVFRRVVESGDTYMFDPGIAEADARAAWLFCGEEQSRTYLAVTGAEAGGEVVGTAILKPNQPGLGDHIANAAWMVAPAVSGRGIGRRFAMYVLDEARALGFAAMQFNAVVASNDRAIGLWESLGFRIIGTVPGAFRHATRGATPIHIMYREL